MIKIILFLLTFIQLNAVQISPSEEERMALVAEQMESDQSHIWPTLNWKSAPLIVSFENGDIFAFNLKTKDPAWEKILLSGHQVLYTKQDKWGLMVHHMQSDFEIEGQSAFLYQMKMTDSVFHDVSILAHERFHRHQGEKFEMREGQGMSVDFLNEENLTWSEIEDDLLRGFLKSTGAEKMEYLKDYIAVNNMRREAIDPLTKQWENGQLRMEGIADYVSTKALGGESLLLALHPEMEHKSDFIDESIKWRHYMAGATIAYALDYVGVKDWKATIENGDALPDLLSRSMPINKPDQEQRIVKVQARLNYKKRRKKVDDCVDNYFDRVGQIEGKYEKQDGVKMFLGRPPVSISGGGANDELVYLDGGTVVALNDSSVASTNDGKWSFETKRISHLYQHNLGVREVKIDKKAAVLINQVWFSMDELLEQPREYPFNSLKIECKNSFLDSKEHTGILVVDQDGLHIRYL